MKTRICIEGIPRGNYYRCDTNGNILEPAKEVATLTVNYVTAIFHNAEGKTFVCRIVCEENKKYLVYYIEIGKKSIEVWQELVYKEKTKILMMKSADASGYYAPTWFLRKD